MRSNFNPIPIWVMVCIVWTNQPAHAAPSANENAHVLDYDVVGFQPGSIDQAPLGGDLICSGPAEITAIWNPVDSKIVLIETDGSDSSFVVPLVTDMLFSPNGDLVVLDDPARTLSLWSQTGDLLDSIAVPDIVPNTGRLERDEHTLFAVDLFGNRHQMATVANQRLGAPSGPTLHMTTHTVDWNPKSKLLKVHDGSDAPLVALDLPDAIQASGQILGDSWLIVDAVIQDSPIQVERTAHHLSRTHLKNQTSWALPINERAYIPQRDLTTDDKGRLLVLAPQADGLHIIRVTP